jgi:P27 family predicted phage terminase small subunit
MREKAKEYWKYFMRQRSRMGKAGEQWITPLDVFALRETCECLADLDEVRGMMNSFEDRSPGSSLMYPVKDEKGAVKCLQQTPLAGIRAEASKRAMKAMSEFGLNPASRARIVLQGADADERDELEDIIDL